MGLTDDNLRITGDAMHVLDAQAKIPEHSDKHLGNVKLVSIDPPFNTGQAFRAVRGQHRTFGSWAQMKDFGQ